MLDPSRITNFNLNEYQLQEMILFWVLVAGKTAKTTARLLDEMLNKFPKSLPFEVLNKCEDLETLLKKSGFGCQRVKARAIRGLIEKDFNLKTCSVSDLEGVYGIGPKTARCFIMHTRKNSRYAGLDTHVLKWLRDLGYDVPKSTPSGKNYLELEEIFLAHAEMMNIEPTDLDLQIWNSYSENDRTKVG